MFFILDTESDTIVAGPFENEVEALDELFLWSSLGDDIKYYYIEQNRHSTDNQIQS